MVRLFVWMGVVRCVRGMGGLDLTAGAPDMVVFLAFDVSET